jgi:poly(3-hydroxybutyrate) depolymerase
MPFGGGDARVVAKLPGGLEGVVVAGDGTIVAGSALMPSSAGPDADEDVRRRRKEAGVSAILHEETPVRFWDRDLGPDRLRLVAARIDGDQTDDGDRAGHGYRNEDGDQRENGDRAEDGDSRAGIGEGGPAFRDLTGHAGRALNAEDGWDLSPDGRTVVSSWIVAERAGSERATLVAIDTATGARRVIADDPGHWYGSPRVSPDGRMVAVTVRRNGTHDDPGDVWLAIAPLDDAPPDDAPLDDAPPDGAPLDDALLGGAPLDGTPPDGGAVRDLTADWDRRPTGARWTPDGTALIVAADDQGRSPLWRVDVATGAVERLTHDDGAYTDVRVSPDGRWVYALRSAIDCPPAPVRIALGRSHSATELLLGPAQAVRSPGRLAEVTAEAADGTPLRAWLALPSDAAGDAPVPLLLWVHGGPVSSWNSWSWRWNPWIPVAHGYAVLLPDPAFSTGYGHEFVKRGWGGWGAAPYTDLMAITDAALERPDLDAGRVAAMGGSFGGYMANWMAGHTDRFAAIVTHASLWALDQMGATTDTPYWWRREWTARRQDDNTPSRFADAITTPMLVIHGNQDFRVPIGEAMRLWWDLLSRSTTEDGSTPHKFLYFPDEGHWILKPGNAKVWYATVLAFLAHHLRGEQWERPAELG